MADSNDGLTVGGLPTFLAFVSFVLHLLEPLRPSPHLSYFRSEAIFDQHVRSVTNERENVKKLFALTVASIALASAAMTAMADANGNAAEARAMLEKAAAAVKADRATALSQMAKGEAGFKDRDLYAFCGGADGIFSAHPSLIGKSMRELKSPDGDPIGQKLYGAASEGTISEVSYMWPKPGSTALTKKVTLVTKVADQVCGVGYYQ